MRLRLRKWRSTGTVYAHAWLACGVPAGQFGPRAAGNVPAVEWTQQRDPGAPPAAGLGAGWRIWRCWPRRWLAGSVTAPYASMPFGVWKDEVTDTWVTVV